MNVYIILDQDIDFLNNNKYVQFLAHIILYLIYQMRFIKMDYKSYIK